MSDITDHAWMTIRVDRDGPIVTVTLNRLEKRNALNGELMAELTEAARALRLKADVRAVILAGGLENFSAGADLGGIKDRTTGPTLLESREAVMAGPDLCRAWEEIEAVTIAAVEGGTDITRVVQELVHPEAPHLGDERDGFVQVPGVGDATSQRAAQAIGVLLSE